MCDYAMSGTPELADNAVAKLKDVGAALLANHGLVSVGPSLDRTLHIAGLVERAAQIVWGARSLGDLHPVPEDVGRNFANLMTLATGATTDGNGGWSSIRFNGKSNQQNYLNYDGVDGTYVCDATPGYLNVTGSQFRLQTSMESIAEFRVNWPRFRGVDGSGAATGDHRLACTEPGMCRYQELLTSLRQAFPAPVSDPVHDGYVVFSLVKALDRVDSLKSQAPILGTPREPRRFKRALRWLLEEASKGHRIEIGCAGGHGRTGSTLAGRGVTWRSSDTLIATVEPTGTVFTLDAGRVTIYASAGGKELAMAPPGDGFSAHQHRSSLSGQLFQLIHNTVEVICQHEICVSSKCGDPPGSVWRVGRGRAKAAEISAPDIRHLFLAQRTC